MARMKKNFIKAFWSIILLLIGNCLQVYAKADIQFVRNVELLFVIDNSGSVAAEAESIMQTIDLLYDWLKKEPMISSIQCIAMDGEAQYAEYKEFPPAGQYTCIKNGIKLADEWIEKRCGDGKFKGIVFVTDLMESHRAVPGEVFDKASEQEEINAILQRWETDYYEEMDYRFFTWNIDESTLKLDREYICDIPDSKLCNLTEIRGDESKEVISNINLTGNVMKKIIEMLTGVELKGGSDTTWLKEISVKKSLCTYIIVEKGTYLSDKEDQDGKPLLPEAISQTESMQIYRLAEQDTKKDYQLQSDRGKVLYFLLYIPKVDMDIIFNHNLDMSAGEEFQINCEFKNNDYRQWTVGETLYLRMKDQETGNEEIIPLIKSGKEYIGSGILEHAGTYSYIIQTERNKVLAEGNKEVKGNRRETEFSDSDSNDTDIQDESGQNIIPKLIAVIPAGIIVIFIISKR